jgi:transposase
MCALILTLLDKLDLQEIRIHELEGRFSLNSRNSSKPPSSDGLAKPKPKSLRVAGQAPSGGQSGHAGSTKKQVANPDFIEVHAAPKFCDVCQAQLLNPELAEIRQVFELPSVKMQVTEHRAMRAQCTCGKTHKAQFPTQVTGSMVYGPVAQATMVYLNNYQMLPLQRITELFHSAFNLPISEAAILKANAEAVHRLNPVVDAIRQALTSAPVLHVDETGLRVNGTLKWLHTAATKTLTWLGVHENRGAKAFAHFELLPLFKGVMVHDGWKPYRALDCTHSLCNAHHLRELTYVHEEQGQVWAGQMITLLKAACAAVGDNGVIEPMQLAPMRAQYAQYLEQGKVENPLQAASGKPGRVKQTKARNLLNRLELYAADVWRFAVEPDVDFTNNLAEQAVRMPKVKQKISGCFRTDEGARSFGVMRSYLASAQKQGFNLYQALVETFQGAPPALDLRCT